MKKSNDIAGVICIIVLICMVILGYSRAAHAQDANSQYALVPAAARTVATFNTADQANTYFKGAHFIVNIPAYTSGNYTVHVQGKDVISGQYYDVLVSPALAATGMTILKVYPGLTPVANSVANDLLPQTWRVQLIGASSPSMTISCSVLLEY